VGSFSIESRGSFKNIEKFFATMSRGDIYRRLDTAAQRGVRALQNATPRDTSLAANSWSYEIRRYRSGWRIDWVNSDIENGFPVAIMIQTGYATGTGGYVAGIDYINPAMRPIFEQIADEAWKAVTSA